MHIWLTAVQKLRDHFPRAADPQHVQSACSCSTGIKQTSEVEAAPRAAHTTAPKILVCSVPQSSPHCSFCASLLVLMHVEERGGTACLRSALQECQGRCLTYLKLTNTAPWSYSDIKRSEKTDLILKKWVGVNAGKKAGCQQVHRPSCNFRFSFSPWYSLSIPLRNNIVGLSVRAISVQQ